MNQTKAIEEHLLKGNTITSKEAFEKFGCTRLSAKIHELRKKYDIRTLMCEGQTRYGDTCHYGKYKLYGILKED